MERSQQSINLRRCQGIRSRLKHVYAQKPATPVVMDLPKHFYPRYTPFRGKRLEQGLYQTIFRGLLSIVCGCGKRCQLLVKMPTFRFLLGMLASLLMVLGQYG